MHREGATNATYAGFILRFRPDKMVFLGLKTPESTNPTPKLIIDRIQALRIHVDFIPRDSEIVGESAELIINGSIRKEFRILRQTNDPFLGGLNPNDNGIFNYATNSAQ